MTFNLSENRKFAIVTNEGGSRILPLSKMSFKLNGTEVDVFYEDTLIFSSDNTSDYTTENTETDIIIALFVNGASHNITQIDNNVDEPVTDNRVVYDNTNEMFLGYEGTVLDLSETLKMSYPSIQQIVENSNTVTDATIVLKVNDGTALTIKNTNDIEVFSIEVDSSGNITQTIKDKSGNIVLEVNTESRRITGYDANSEPSFRLDLNDGELRLRDTTIKGI